MSEARLLRLIAEVSRKSDRSEASRDTVESLYGPGFRGAFVHLLEGGQVERGGNYDSILLTDLGWAMAQRPAISPASTSTHLRQHDRAVPKFWSRYYADILSGPVMLVLVLGTLWLGS